MDKLCVELKIKIIAYLSIGNRLKLKLLNKEWKYIIDKYFKIENLAIYKFKKKSHGFLDSEESIDCYTMNFNKFKSKFYSNENQFANLKRLFLYVNSPKRLFFQPGDLISPKDEAKIELYEKFAVDILAQLEKFEKLVCLDLIFFTTKYPGRINSSNLKYLSFETFGDCLIFNTPKLTHLKIKCHVDVFDKMKFLYPQSIKYLETRTYKEIIFNFINLEYLYIDNNIFRYPDEDQISIKLLKKLTKLKKLFILPYRLNKPFIDDFLKLKKNNIPSMRNLELYLGYLRLDRENDFDLNSYLSDFYTGSIESLDNNLDRLSDKFNLFDELNYSDIESYYIEKSKKIPINLINKFTNLKRLTIGNFRSKDSERKVNDLDSLINLLRNSKKIEEITFHAYVPQKFYDLLPYLGPNLHRLSTFFRCHDQDLDLDFLFNFRNLNYLMMWDIYMPIEIVFNLFKRTDLCKICFRLNRNDEKSISISYINGYYLSEDKKKFKDLNELSKYLNI